MVIDANNLVKFGYVIAIGLGGGFLTKKATQTTIWIWNKCRTTNSISSETEKKILRYSEIIGGLFFAILAAREVFSENSLSKQIKALKADLKNLEGEVGDLFKSIYEKGKDRIREFGIR